MVFYMLGSWTGATSVDALYMLVVYFGSVHFSKQRFYENVSFSFGCFVLIYTGIEGLMSTGKITQHRNARRFGIKVFFFQVFNFINKPAYYSFLAWYLWLCFSQNS